MARARPSPPRCRAQESRHISAIKNADEVQLRLRELRSIFDLSVGAYALLTEEPARSELAKYTIRYNDQGAFQATKSDTAPEGWRLTQEIRFRDGDYRPAAEALVERTKRQVIIESFDLIRSHAKGTPAWDELGCEPWFDFVCLYRNAVAHNGRWEFKDDKVRSKLPITFMNLRIDETMEGLTINGFLTHWKARQLLGKLDLFLHGNRMIF